MKKDRLCRLQHLLIIVFTLLITAGLCPRAFGGDSAALPPGYRESGPLRPNGQITVQVKNGVEWVDVGSLPFDKHLREESLDLAGILPSAQQLINVRLVKTGEGSAHLDSAFLGDTPPVRVDGAGGLPLDKLSQKDYDLINVGENGVEIEFTAGAGTFLRVVGRIEDLVISQAPFQFPLVNTYRKIDENSSFYKYSMGSRQGSLSMDGDIEEVTGLDPFMKEFVYPGSGHPPGFIYAWVMNDSQNLYVAFDTTPDNTLDGDKDYARVYARTPEGIKEFKVSVPEVRWGMTGFGYTGRVAYQHKMYEFSIPLQELGISAGDTGRELELAFAAYGTMAPRPNRTEPAVAYDPDNEQYLIVYDKVDIVESYDTEDYVYGKIIGTDNNVVKDEFKISTGQSQAPSVAYDPGSGKFLVVWQDIRNWDDSYSDVYGQYLYANGDADGENFPISTALNSQISPTVASGDNNDFLVVWSDDRSVSRDVYGQLVNYSLPGYLEGENFAISDENYDETDPSVAHVSFNGNSSYLVAWCTEDFDIFGKLLNESCSPVSSNLPIADGVNWQQYPSLASDSVNGQFLVTWDEDTWQSDNDNGNLEIYGRLVDAQSGDFLTSALTVSDAVSHQGKSSAAFDSANTRFLISWEDYRNGESDEDMYHDIYGQFVDADGSTIETASQTNFEIRKDIGEQCKPAVAYNSTNASFLVAFEAWPTDFINPSEIAFEAVRDPSWTVDCTLTSSSITRTGLTLSWSGATDNVGVTGYRLYRGGNLLDTVSGSVYSYDVTGLSADTQYTFKVEAGDAAGNWSANGPSIIVSTAVYGGGGEDTTPPMVTGANPADGTANVPVNSNITINFSEDVVLADSSSITLKDQGSHSINKTTGVTGNVFTIDPADNLGYSVSYTVYIPATSVTDMAGNPLANNCTFSFSTQASPGGGGYSSSGLVLPIPKTCTVTGRLVELNGGPLSGMYVYIFPASGSGSPVGVITGPDGSYQITGLTPGQYKIEFAPETTVPNRFMPEWHNNSRSWREADTVTLGQGETMTVNATMDPPRPRAIGRQPMGSGIWYRVIIPAGALKDAQGTPLTRDYSATFTTGDY